MLLTVYNLSWVFKLNPGFSEHFCVRLWQIA
jgi:hypothetical protein